WEFKFLQPALLRDRRVEASFILTNADLRVSHAGPPFLPSFPDTREKFFEAKYDLVILGDVPATYLGKQRMEGLRERVADKRGGLVVTAGRQHAPASCDGTPLAEVLPVEFLPVKFKVEDDARPQAYNPVLTDAGERADMLALADEAAENRK